MQRARAGQADTGDKAKINTVRPEAVEGLPSLRIRPEEQSFDKLRTNGVYLGLVAGAGLTGTVTLHRSTPPAATR